TGRQAFACDTIPDTIAAVLEREPDWAVLPRSLSPAIHRLLRRCLEKDALARVQDIGVVNETLQHALDRVHSKTFAFASARARSWIVVGIGAGVLAAIAVTIVAFLPREHAPAQAPSASLPVNVVPVVHRQLTFVGDVGESALSPDGRTIAYTSAGR